MLHHPSGHVRSKQQANLGDRLQLIGDMSEAGRAEEG